MGIRILAKRCKSARLAKPSGLTITDNNSLCQLSVGMRVISPADIITQSPRKFSGDLSQSQRQLTSMVSKLKELAQKAQPNDAPPKDPYQEMVGELDRLTQSYANRAFEMFQRQVKELRAPATKAKVRRRLGVLHEMITDGNNHQCRSVSDHKIRGLLDEVGIQAANRRSLRFELDPQELTEVITAINAVASS